MRLMMEFDGEFPTSEHQRIFNADSAVASMLQCLTHHGVLLVNEGLWNDFGWCATIRYEGDEFFVRLAKYEESRLWECTVESSERDSLFSSVLRKKRPEFANSLKYVGTTLFQWSQNTENVTNEMYYLSTKPKQGEIDPCLLEW